MRFGRWLGRLALALLLAACGEAGDPLDRMAAEHEGDRGDATGAARLAADASGVETEEVEYGRIEGTALRGYLARPEGGARGAPGILVIHEWWGVNDNIRAMTRQLAAEGLVALAVDLYEGRSTDSAVEARLLAGGAMEREERVEENLRLAHAYLSARRRAPRVGVIGWCFGGGWSLRTALLMPEGIDAAVMYYGRPELDPQRLGPLRAPLLGVFAGRDRAIPIQQVRGFERVLEDLGKEATIRVYAEADHAFANPSGNRYEEAAAQDAWAATVAFLGEHLLAE